MNNGPVDQPCRWACIAHTLDHRALVQDHGHGHVEPATATGTRCPCGWRNVGILLVGAPTDETGGELDACQVIPRVNDGRTVVW